MSTTSEETRTPSVRTLGRWAAYPALALTVLAGACGGAPEDGMASDDTAATELAAVPAIDHSAKVHAGLYEVVTGVDGTVWVAATGSAQAEGARVIGLDPLTLEVRQSIDVTDAPAFGIAANHRTGTLYTSNTRAGTMSAIDPATGTVTSIANPAATDGAHLYRVLVDEDANLVYSTVASAEGAIWVVDGATNTFETLIEDIGSRPTGLALDKDANRLYVALQGDSEVVAVDLDSHEIVARIPTEGERSTQLALDEEGDRLFVANQGTNDISVIDTEAGAVIRRVPTGDQALSVAYHAPTDRIYVANRSAGTVTVLDGATYEVLANLEVGTFPNSIHVDEDTGRVYVTNKAQRSSGDGPPTVDPNGDKVTLIGS